MTKYHFFPLLKSLTSQRLWFRYILHLRWTSRNPKSQQRSIKYLHAFDSGSLPLSHTLWRILPLQSRKKSKTVWRCGTDCTLQRGTYHRNSVIFEPNLLIVLVHLSGRLRWHAAQTYGSAADLNNSVWALPMLSKGRLYQMRKPGRQIQFCWLQAALQLRIWANL